MGGGAEVGFRSGTEYGGGYPLWLHHGGLRDGERKESAPSPQDPPPADWSEEGTKTQRAKLHALTWAAKQANRCYLDPIEQRLSRVRDCLEGLIAR